MHSQQRKNEGRTTDSVGWARRSQQPSGPSTNATMPDARRAPVRIGPLSHDLAARVVLGEVGRDFEVEVSLLLATGRCTAAIALSRQVAMYLLHVELGRQLSEVGRLLGRDRTTVAHACAHIEDMREDAGFDGRIDAIESAIRVRLSPCPETAEARHAERA
jgi:hypothetical protein